MPTPTEGKPELDPAQAAEHVASAHLAITKLEMALNILAIQTGGLL